MIYNILLPESITEVVYYPEASEFCVMCNVKCEMLKKHKTSHMKHYTRIEGLGDASAILMMRRVRSIVYQGQ